MRNMYDPAPLTVAVPKMIADVLSVLQETVSTELEWTLMSIAEP